MGKLLTVAMTEFVVEMSAEFAREVGEGELDQVLSLVDVDDVSGELFKLKDGDWCSPQEIADSSQVEFAAGWDSLNRWGRGDPREMPRMIYLSAAWHWKLRQRAPRWVTASVTAAPRRRSRSG